MKSKTGIWIKKHSILIIVFLSIRTKLIDNAVVKFKTIPAVKGLQATYFGNFRTSDRAWFALLDYEKI
jgi:effector-binding domain-containing protein